MRETKQASNFSSMLRFVRFYAFPWKAEPSEGSKAKGEGETLFETPSAGSCQSGRAERIAEFFGEQVGNKLASLICILIIYVMKTGLPPSVLQMTPVDDITTS